jgi:sulfotransferase family protein
MADRGKRRTSGPQGKGGALRPPRWANVGDPPPAPAGWHTGAPDFVGVGVQRAGTKWWYELVTDHPRVERVATTKKELHFFDRFWREEFDAAEVERYHAFFPRPTGAVTGEWTPRYMHDPWIPALLRRAAPDARLLVLLRDPVERYQSGIAREQRLADKRGEPLDAAVWADAFARGLYGMQLAHVFKHFPPDQVLVLQYERCAVDPVPELRRTYAFLGLEPDHEPESLRDWVGRINPKDALPGHVRSGLAAAYAVDIGRLAELCPDLDLSLWPSLAEEG